MNDTNTTRCRFLSGAAVSSAAVAVPAVAVASAGSDAELLALGRKFDAVRIDHRASCARSEKAERRLKAMWPETPPELRARGPFDDAGIPPGGQFHWNIERLEAVVADPFVGLGITAPRSEWTEPHSIDRLERARARATELLPFAKQHQADVERAFEDSGYNACAAAQNAFCDRLDEIAERVRELPAATLAGVAVKARIMRDWDALGFYDEERSDDELDWPLLMLKGFLDQLAGLPPTA